MNTIGERIKFLRIEHDLTQQQLASICHVGRSTIAKYENNEIEPSKEVKIVLTNFFHVTLDFLYGLSNYTNQKVFVLNNKKFTEVPLLNIKDFSIINTIVVPIHKVCSGNKFFFAYAPCNLSDYRINSGDLLYIKKQSTAENGDIVLFKYNDNFLIARYFKHHQIILYNSTLNTGFLCVSKEQIKILGIILEVSFSIKQGSE